MLSAPSRVSAAKIFKPIATMSDYVPVKHPKLSALDKHTATIIAALENVADANVELGPWTVGAEAAEAADESWKIMLRNLRILDAELDGGLATQRFRRELRMHRKPMLPKFNAAVAAAIKTVRQMRAFSAVMCGENDDEELGIEVIPPPSKSSKSGPSVDFVW